MRQVSSIVTGVAVVVILASGCATRGWVRDTLDQKEVEIGQRIDGVDGQVRREAQRVDVIEVSVSDGARRVEGMNAKVETLQGSVTQTSTRADGIDSRLTRLWTNRYNAKVVETLDVHFAFDQAELGDEAQTALRGLLNELRNNPGLTVELMGYADQKGAREYNFQLSQRRVDAVRRYLVDNGVRMARVQTVALGMIADPSIPMEKKRRVTVHLMVDQD